MTEKRKSLAKLGCRMVGIGVVFTCAACTADRTVERHRDAEPGLLWDVDIDHEPKHATFLTLVKPAFARREVHKAMFYTEVNYFLADHWTSDTDGYVLPTGTRLELVNVHERKTITTGRYYRLHFRTNKGELLEWTMSGPVPGSRVSTDTATFMQPDLATVVSEIVYGAGGK